MHKYTQVFKISIQQEFAYRLSFVMWRVRNIISLLMIFFLWDSVFLANTPEVFGYNKSRILTYVLAMLVVRAIVFSSRTVDVGGEIGRGELSTHLLRPIKYFYWWFTRDFASKVLNLGFAAIETSILVIVLRPSLFLQTNIVSVLLFLVSLITATLIYFLIVLIFGMMPFWYPEQAWGFVFLMTIFIDFLSGAMFPLDILPATLMRLTMITPFPYLVFTPLQIFLGKFDVSYSILSVVLSLIWVGILIYIVRKMWRAGLRVYGAEGR